MNANKNFAKTQSLNSDLESSLSKTQGNFSLVLTKTKTSKELLNRRKAVLQALKLIDTKLLIQSWTRLNQIGKYLPFVEGLRLEPQDNSLDLKGHIEAPPAPSSTLNPFDDTVAKNFKPADFNFDPNSRPNSDPNPDPNLGFGADFDSSFSPKSIDQAPPAPITDNQLGSGIAQSHQAFEEELKNPQAINLDNPFFSPSAPVAPEIPESVPESVLGSVAESVAEPLLEATPDTANSSQQPFIENLQSLSEPPKDSLTGSFASTYPANTSHSSNSSLDFDSRPIFTSDFDQEKKALLNKINVYVDTKAGAESAEGYSVEEIDLFRKVMTMDVETFWRDQVLIKEEVEEIEKIIVLIKKLQRRFDKSGRQLEIGDSLIKFFKKLVNKSRDKLLSETYNLVILASAHKKGLIGDQDLKQEKEAILEIKSLRETSVGSNADLGTSSPSILDEASQSLPGLSEQKNDKYLKILKARENKPSIHLEIENFGQIIPQITDTSQTLSNQEINSITHFINNTKLDSLIKILNLNRLANQEEIKAEATNKLLFILSCGKISVKPTSKVDIFAKAASENSQIALVEELDSNIRQFSNKDSSYRNTLLTLLDGEFLYLLTKFYIDTNLALLEKIKYLAQDDRHKVIVEFYISLVNNPENELIKQEIRKLVRQQLAKTSQGKAIIENLGSLNQFQVQIFADLVLSILETNNLQNQIQDIPVELR